MLASANSSGPRAALLDVDGTLIDSNDAHAHAWVSSLAQFGHNVAFERVRELIGKGGDKLLPETTGLAKDSPAGRSISDRRVEVFRNQHLPRLQPLPGARALLERMHAQGLRLVVATSASREEVDALLGIAGVRDLVDATTTSDDAERSKPDPDIVEAALRAAGCAPTEAVFLGDTPYDVEAARRAGVAVVALRCGGWSDDDLRGATAIYDTPADVLTHYERSPFAAR